MTRLFLPFPPDGTDSKSPASGVHLPSWSFRMLAEDFQILTKPSQDPLYRASTGSHWSDRPE